MLTPERKKQLDDNIKKMVANGATQAQILAYSKDFHAKYDNEQSTGFPEWAKCLESSGAKKKNDNVVFIVNSKGNTLYFSKSGKFQYTFTSKPGEPNQMGNWRCNGTNGYLINMDNGDRWDGTKWIEGSQNNGGGNSSSDENSVSNGIYTTKGDPYQYKIVNCVWYTKGKKITDWKSLEDNKDATGILDGRFPNARKKCKEDKPEENKVETTTVVLPEWVDCIKTIKTIKSTQDSNNEEIVFTPFGEDKGYFWKDKSVVYVSKDGTKIYGKWSCKNNILTIVLESGDVFTVSSGWVKPPNKTDNTTPTTNFDPTQISGDEFSTGGSTDSTPNAFTSMKKDFPDTIDFSKNKTLNLNQNESTMNNLENIINEVNSLIIEQTQQIVQAPKDELTVLTTSPFLKDKGTLEALCRSNNGTSKPVNVNGKIYFAGRKVKRKNNDYYLTYDGMVLKREGNSCKFTYAPTDDKKGVMKIKGIPYSDLDLQYTDILMKFGIDPKNYDSDPYFSIDSITADLKKLVAQGAVSSVFKSWNDMLTYYHSTDYNNFALTPIQGKSLNPPTNRGELSQYRVLNGRNVGLNYNDKDVVIYVPATAAPIAAGGGKKQYDETACKTTLIEYLSASIRYETQQDPSDNPTINNAQNRQFIKGCYGANKYSGLTVTQTDLPDVGPDTKIFRWFRGKTLSIKEVSYLLSGKDKNLPAGKNPYLPFPIRKDDMNESKIILDNLIKENLQKLSEEKNNNLLAETKIIQTRTKILTENRILKFKQPREKFFNEIISESIYLESQGFDKQIIKEEFWDSIKGLFGQHGSEAIFGTFKEYMGKWLLQKLTPVNPDGWIGSIIVTAIGNLHIDDLSKLTDCNFLTKKLSSSIGEGIARKIQHDKGYDGGISDIVRNGLFSAIDNTEMVKSLENGLAKLICPALSGVKSKLEDKAQKMKTMAVQA
jgi:hypothetical protein